MSTKLKLIVNNPELIPDEVLEAVMDYTNRPSPALRSHLDENDRKAIARWFGNGLCNTAS